MIQNSRGLTLVELMITILIVSIGVSLALPTWDRIMQRRELTQGAEEIAALLAIAQGEAVKRNESIEVDVSRDSDKHWCVLVYTEANADECLCDTAPPDAGYTGYCGWAAGRQTETSGEKSVYRIMSLTQLLEGGTGVSEFNLRFDPVRGLKIADDETTDFDMHGMVMQSDSTEFTLRVDINTTGRVSVCSPDESVHGYGDCQG